MKKNNIPLNFREKINSRISLLCSIVVMVLLVLVIHQLDYTLIRKPQKEAAEAVSLKEEQEKIRYEYDCCSRQELGDRKGQFAFGGDTVRSEDLPQYDAGPSGSHGKKNF